MNNIFEKFGGNWFGYSAMFSSATCFENGAETVTGGIKPHSVQSLKIYGCSSLSVEVENRWNGIFWAETFI